MTLQDWANIVPIVGAIGTLIVGIAALAVSVGALVTQYIKRSGRNVKRCQCQRSSVSWNRVLLIGTAFAG